MFLYLVEKTFDSATPQNGPLIEGTISALFGARYSVHVEIKETDFGFDSEYVIIKIDNQDFGKCTPSGTGTCNWYRCTLEKDEIESANYVVFIFIQFSNDVNALEHCENQVEARITLQLIGEI